MILTDREIQIALEQGVIIIDPQPAERAYSSTSIDLTLDPILTIFQDGAMGIEQVVDPTHDQFDHDRALEQLTVQHPIEPSGYVFHPNKLILAWTREYIKLDIKSKLAARVEGKSSLARLGIAVHITAPTIHAGFEGQVRLEMINHGRLPVRLRPDMRICQLIFEQTSGTPVRGYKGRFSGQTKERRG